MTATAVAALPDLDRSVHVWRIPLRAGDSTTASLLSADESERASRFHFSRDRDRFVAARSALRRVLGGLAATAPGSLTFGYTSHGKPFLVGAGAELSFNLSHSHELALLAVTCGRALGIDLEWHRPEVEIESLARTTFSPAEQRALLALPPGERVDAFFRGWARKESYIKARGEGLSMPLDRFSVSLDAASGVHFDSDDADEGARWVIRGLAIDSGYAAALTVAAPCPPLVMHELD